MSVPRTISARPWSFRASVVVVVVVVVIVVVLVLVS